MCKNITRLFGIKHYFVLLCILVPHYPCPNFFGYEGHTLIFWYLVSDCIMGCCTSKVVFPNQSYSFLSCLVILYFMQPRRCVRKAQELNHILLMGWYWFYDVSILRSLLDWFGRVSGKEKRSRLVGLVWTSQYRSWLMVINLPFFIESQQQVASSINF